MKINKINIVLALLSSSLFTYAQYDIPVTLKGKIINPNSDSIIIKNGWGEEFHTIEVDKNGQFESEFEIGEGYYSFFDKKEQSTIYLGEDYQLEITLKTDSFDESINYTGYGAEANNYLAAKALMREKWGLKNYYGYFCKLSETDFLHLTDSIYSVSMNLLIESNIKDERFLKLEKNSIENERIRKIDMYPGTYKYFTGTSPELSETFPNPYKNFPVNDPSLIDAPGFLSAVVGLASFERDSTEYKKAGDYTLYVLQSLNQKVTNNKVRVEAMHYFCKSRLTGSKKMDECFSLYQAIETDPSRLKLIKDKYLARKKTQKGASSPPFVYEDLNGQVVTNEDLKGKLLYIDLWATWCGPCLREIPYFDTLQEAFKNQEITFLSVCQNDTKERWQKMVKTKELKGLHLYAEGDGGQFYKDYQVDGIPRYILLDAEGKIIDSDAKRPSNPLLKAELAELLK